jgi:hypothetical protein
MGYKSDLNERIFGGSIERRLSPKIANTELNAKLGSRHFPSPMVRQTETSCIEERGTDARKARIGTPDRFKRY